MLSLNNIKTKNLQNKITEIKTQKDRLKYNLTNLQSLYEGYKIQTKRYLNQYKLIMDNINTTRTEMMLKRMGMVRMQLFGNAEDRN